jgi:hypothetical protein
MVWGIVGDGTLWHNAAAGAETYSLARSEVMQGNA